MSESRLIVPASQSQARRLELQGLELDHDATMAKGGPVFKAPARRVSRASQAFIRQRATAAAAKESTVAGKVAAYEANGCPVPSDLVQAYASMRPPMPETTEGVQWDDDVHGPLANAQGWGLFLCTEVGYRLERLDEDSMFASDEQAMTWVYLRWTRHRDETAGAALRFLKENAPLEYEYILAVINGEV